MVAHEQGHTVARLQPGGLKLCGQVRAALGPLAVSGPQFRAFKDGGPHRVHAGLALQQVGEVQFGTPAKQATIVA
jgi:hypothetical protein